MYICISYSIKVYTLKMADQPISSTFIPGSPVEHTLGLLQERLAFAEEETLKLSKGLVTYGFKR